MGFQTVASWNRMVVCFKEFSLLRESIYPTVDVNRNRAIQPVSFALS